MCKPLKKFKWLWCQSFLHNNLAHVLGIIIMLKDQPTYAQEILQRSQQSNGHKNVDVGRVVANKSEYCNPNHFNISYFNNLFSFSLFGFTFMQLITWTLALITSSLCFLIWIVWQLEPKLSVYNILSFVRNCIWLIKKESSRCAICKDDVHMSAKNMREMSTTTNWIY